MSLRSTRWLQEGKAVRKKEWTLGAFIILVKRNDKTFILSHWPKSAEEFVFIPAGQLPAIIKAEQNWPDTYECMPDQQQIRTFLLQRIPGIVFYNEVTAIRRAYNFFRQNRTEISRKSSKRFVIIANEEVIAEYDDPIEGALTTLQNGYELGEFIVQDLTVDTLIFQTRATFNANEN